MVSKQPVKPPVLALAAVLRLGHQEHLGGVVAGYGTDVGRDLIRAWWSLRCLTNVRWLAEHGYGSLVIRHRAGLSRVTVLPRHFSRALAARLGREAVEAIEKGSYRGPGGRPVNWADEVRAAVRAKESIPPELPLAAPGPRWRRFRSRSLM